MSPARSGPRPVIGTRELLRAINDHGALWPAAFSAQEIRSVAEAVDREHLKGNLVDGKTLSEQGRRELARLLGSDKPEPVEPVDAHGDQRRGRGRQHPAPGRADPREARTRSGSRPPAEGWAP